MLYSSNEATLWKSQKSVFPRGENAQKKMLIRSKTQRESELCEEKTGF